MDRLAALRSDFAAAIGGAPWHGPSLADALDGLTAEAATARAFANAHTIAEIVAHLAVWADVPRLRLGGAVVEPTPDEDWPGPGPWSEASARLAAAHNALLTAIDRLSDADLDRVVRRGDGSADGAEPYTAATMLRGVVQHISYHSGQIAMLRKALG
ncbi:MAG TPA: DinB family protein [Rubricoccaceae bacterium]|jgi:uncharacterized damage-inducible protein DinB